VVEPSLVGDIKGGGNGSLESSVGFWISVQIPTFGTLKSLPRGDFKKYHLIEQEAYGRVR
jgi:hypothetical protein